MDLVNRVDFIFLVAVEEENEVEANDTMLSNNFDKLNELESHLIRHRELFLSRQIETYKIDMVRYVWLWEEFSCVVGVVYSATVHAGESVQCLC